MEEPKYYVKTPHFSYVLHTEPIKSVLNGILLYVGNKENPCLEATVYFPGGDDRLNYLTDEALLSKIDAIEQCALDYDNDESFGSELLFSFINMVKANYKHIKRIRLHDASYIPCNRATGDTLDLLTYSIALYGKTWYESKTGAYPVGNEKVRKLYEESINHFISPELKQITPFAKIYHDVGAHYARKIIDGSLSTYENMYNSSKTFPEFFKALSKTIPKHDKCKFFKGWLELFVGNYVSFPRDWIIDIESNPVLGNVLNVSQARPMSPRSRTVKARKNRKQGSRRTRKK